MTVLQKQKSSQLFTSLSFFLETLALHDIIGAAQCFDDADPSSLIFTPHELEEYNKYTPTAQ